MHIHTNHHFISSKTTCPPYICNPNQTTTKNPMAPTIATTLYNSNSSSSPTWDVKKFVVTEGHGVKGLSDRGLKTIPHQYIQPLAERLDTSTLVTEDDQDYCIPVIDMSNWNEDQKKVSDSICDAAEKWGFFQIINHGVDLQVLENVKKATHRFFELPTEEKRKYSKENSSSNSVRFGTSFTPDSEKALEWKDYLSLFYVSDHQAASLWPPVCKDEVLEFKNSAEVVIRRLMEVLMKRMNINRIDKEKESLLMGSTRINLNYYPKCPNPELTVGVGRHSDVSNLTILLQDDIGGLYVKKITDDTNDDVTRWIHVPPISGSLVINIGDALQIMSNGLYKSVEHRVTANGSHSRVSVPIFVSPSPSSRISPLPEILEKGEKALYKEVRYSDYVLHFFRKSHDGKDTVDYAKI